MVNFFFNLFKGKDVLSCLEELFLIQPVIGTTAAILGAAAIGTAGAVGSSMYASSQQEKSQANALQAQQEANQPSLDYQQAMLPYQTEIMRDYTMPYIRETYPEERRLMTEYQLPMQEEALKMGRDQYMPYAKEMGQYLQNRGFGSDVPQLPTLDDTGAYQAARERLALPYEQARQKIGETAAGAGTLRGGPTQQMLSGVDLARLQGEEGLARDFAVRQQEQERADMVWQYQAQQQQESARLREAGAFLGTQQAVPTAVPYMPQVSQTSPGAYPQMGQQQQPGTDWGAIGSNLASFMPMAQQQTPVADPTGSYNVGYGQGYYPGGYSELSGL